MVVWRLCRQQYANAPLDGEGARLYGGRWNYPGTAVVYAAESLALAALEMLVHIDPDLAPVDIVAISIEVPESIHVEEVTLAQLPRNWRSTPAPKALQEIGTAWVRRASSLVLRVPSSVIPEEHNYLLNPAHSDGPRLKTGQPKPFTFDARLLR